MQIGLPCLESYAHAVDLVGSAGAAGDELQQVKESLPLGDGLGFIF